MKRKLAVVLTVAMIASLTACGSPSGDTNVVDQEAQVEDTGADKEYTEDTELVMAESEVTEIKEVTEETEVEETEQESQVEETEKESDENDSDSEESNKKDSDKKDSDNKDSDNKDSDNKDSDKNDSDKTDTNKKDDDSNKPSKKPNKTQKPSKKPNKTEKPSKKPNKTEKPSEKPDKPAKPSDKPDNTENDTSVEQTEDSMAKILLSDFKTIADSQNAQSIAEQLMANKIIEFVPAVMPVEEGLLNGFGNAEITGFKDGVMFGPMIGTIPFIGYVFELKDDTDVNQFISTLKSNADLRWNICTQADELVTGYVGKKVFFVMAPNDSKK